MHRQCDALDRERSAQALQVRADAVLSRATLLHRRIANISQKNVLRYCKSSDGHEVTAEELDQWMASFPIEEEDGILRCIPLPP